MAKAFPKLNQKAVRIEVAGGSSYNVPMLPVAALDELEEMRSKLDAIASGGDAPGVETPLQRLDAVRRQGIRLASTVIPEELQPGLQRLSLEKLMELLSYLFYGDEDDEPEDGAPKN